MKNETPLSVNDLDVGLLGEALTRGGTVLPDEQTAFKKNFKGT